MIKKKYMMIIIIIINNKDHLDQTPLSDEQNKASDDQRLTTRLNGSKSEPGDQVQMIRKKLVKLR